jgi:hypothetical protein
MNTIQAIYDILNKNWDIIPNSITRNDNLLAISFVAGSGLSMAKFNSLSFGFELKLNNQIIAEENYPKSGQNYESADSNPLEYAKLILAPGKEYDLYVYAENAGRRTETSIKFLVPLPDKPYNSWTWDDETMEWLAPLPQPKDFPHEWNESTQSWVKRDMPI